MKIEPGNSTYLPVWIFTSLSGSEGVFFATLTLDRYHRNLFSHLHRENDCIVGSNQRNLCVNPPENIIETKEEFLEIPKNVDPILRVSQSRIGNFRSKTPVYSTQTQGVRELIEETRRLKGERFYPYYYYKGSSPTTLLNFSIVYILGILSRTIPSSNCNEQSYRG